MGSAFVEGGTQRYELPDGDWVDIKQELTYGEARQLAGGGLKREGDDYGLDLEAFAVRRLAMWIVAWSLKDAKGQPVEVSEDSIRNLKRSVGGKLDAIITRHGEALDAEASPETAEEAIEFHRQAIKEIEAAKKEPMNASPAPATS